MSGSPGLSGSARPVTAAQKSAEGIVAGSPVKARTTKRVSRTATLMWTRRQNIQLELALEPAAKGEARSAGARGTEARTARAEPERPAAGQQPSMEAVVEPGNLKKALARVRRNKGAPGVDGMTVDELGDHLKAHCRDQVSAPRRQLHAAAGMAGGDTEAVGRRSPARRAHGHHQLHIAAKSRQGGLRSSTRSIHSEVGGFRS